MEGTMVRRKVKKSGKESSSQELKTGKRKKRFYPGTVALWEIRKCQQSTGFLIWKLSFARRSDGDCPGTEGWPPFQGISSAGSAGGSRGLCSKFFEANLCTIQAKRVTLIPKDFSKVFLLYRTFDCFKDKLSITIVIFIRSENNPALLEKI